LVCFQGEFKIKNKKSCFQEPCRSTLMEMPVVLTVTVNCQRQCWLYVQCSAHVVICPKQSWIFSLPFRLGKLWNWNLLISWYAIMNHSTFKESSNLSLYLEQRNSILF